MTSVLIVSGIIVTAIIVTLYNVLKHGMNPEVKIVIDLRNRTSSHMTETEIDILRDDVMNAVKTVKSSFAKIELSNILLFLDELESLTIGEHITHEDIFKKAAYCYDKVYFGCDKDDKPTVKSHIKFWRMMNKKIKYRTFTIEDIQRAYRAGKNGWYRQKKSNEGFFVGKFKGTEEEYLNDLKSKR